MLQSSNQYLRPDYLAAPNTLDTKSSPLALLAQTCSAIGAESTNPKLAVIIEKSTKSMKSNGDGRDKTSPLSSHSSSSVSTGSVEQQQQPPPSQHQQQQQQSQPKSSFKPYESNNNHLRDRMEAETERAHNLCTVNTNNNNSNNNTNGQCHNTTTPTTNSSHRVKTPKPTNGQHQHQHHQQQTQHNPQQQQQQRCDSNQSATSQRDSPAAASTPISNGLRRTPSAQAMDLQSRVPGSSSNSPQLRGSSKESPPVPTSASQTMAGSAASQNSASATARLQAASDAAAYAAKEVNYVKALHAAAAAASGGSGVNGGGGGGNYYPGYGPGGGSGYPPMDLMTASALMNPHHPMFKAAALSPYLNYARLKGIDPATAAAMMSPNVCRDPFCNSCPASPHFLNKAAGQPCPAGCQQCDNNGKSNAGMSGGGSQAAAAAAASYHAQLAALAAASQMPYMCSWVGTDAAYCGKRFGTSDELFQHLRTHTASMPDSVLSAAAAGGIPPNHPLFRTYPTPPLSPLSAAARYHPYGKPSMLPPPLGPPGMPMPPHPALAQYFSPYALYGGPRMGSSHP